MLCTCLLLLKCTKNANVFCSRCSVLNVDGSFIALFVVAAAHCIRCPLKCGQLNFRERKFLRAFFRLVHRSQTSGCFFCSVSVLFYVCVCYFFKLFFRSSLFVCCAVHAQEPTFSGETVHIANINSTKQTRNEQQQ